MSYKTKDRKVHGTSVIVGENGLPVDTIATISGSYKFLEGNDPLIYNDGIVTLPAGYDLTPITIAKARYTGKYILITADEKIYYINRLSINPEDRTFTISLNDKTYIPPASIDLTKGWEVSEAEIVNRIAVTSAAKVDHIEFRDMHFQMELDGDPVTVRGKNGNTLEPNADGSINVSINHASTPTILNTTLAVAGNEYTIDIPVTARKFMIRSRNPAQFKVAFEAASTNYLTVRAGNYYSEECLSLTLMLTLYITSNKPNTVIETVYWE